QDVFEERKGYAQYIGTNQKKTSTKKCRKRTKATFLTCQSRINSLFFISSQFIQIIGFEFLRKLTIV
ncbi:hypothetical protein, partial [Parafilimonas sp.]|uniref:hypothetical protein n=1 Tax=Parafilimonas sp. TaxID=1969739 RepID=UPI0039E58559